MFFQVRVPTEQRDMLRFLWWEDDDINGKVIECRMKVHVFGASSSPGCANFALRQTAKDNANLFGKVATQTLLRNFYVDDLLKSVKDQNAAQELSGKVNALCNSGGFNLTKFFSPTAAALKELPVEKLSNSIKQLDANKDSHIERALDVYWCLENDSLGFKIVLQSAPLSRRNMLATISSIYDPIGIAGPFILEGKVILQKLVAEKKGWDDPVTEDLAMQWVRWRDNLVELEKLNVQRCYKKNLDNITESTLHYYSDASNIGYGCVSYLRQVSETGEIAVSLIMAKSRVTPIKVATIPRLELTAALLAVKVAEKVREELDVSNCEESFATDSKIVLGYIANESKRFRVFVSNRVQQIRNFSTPDQWYYTPTENNSADYASRGLKMSDSKGLKLWLYGPPELYDTHVPNLQTCEEFNKLDESDIELKTHNKPVVCLSLVPSDDIVSFLERRVSKWSRMKRVLCHVIRFIDICKKQRTDTKELSLQELQYAETQLIKLVQEKYLALEIAIARKNAMDTKLKQRGSSIENLNPFLDNKGVLRVGGRLRNNEDQSTTHPIILPKNCKISTRLVEHYHSKVQHCGRTTTINEVRSNGFWIINVNGITREVINKCIQCRYLRRKTSEQKMADLPSERVISEGPFTYSGIDMFGHFLCKEGRKELKRYGIIFTCFSCRAVHIEMVKTMNTDSFINALRRFIARRGVVRYIRSDNGSNFVGAKRELDEAFRSLDHEKIREYLQSENCEWVSWQYNPPHASHVGGVWERMIRIVRSILNSLLKNVAGRLDDESLETFFCEAEAIINNRPLAPDSLSDVSCEALTPAHLLTMKAKVAFPPPGIFQREDIYCRKRWRQVQALAEQFWSRWRREYLALLQTRNKWQRPSRNFKEGDVVILKDEELFRNHWPLASVVIAKPDSDGLVRKVILRVSHSRTPIERSIHKLLLLVEADDGK